jgi:hypothetical protein
MDDNGPGLRQLAKQFNVWIIESALLDVGNPSLKGEAELLHKLLTYDEVEDSERTRAKQRLERQGIDPDALKDDFVSYRTIDRHFKNCSERRRSASRPSISPNKALDRVNALKRRLEQVTEKSIQEVSQHTDREMTGGDIDVLVQVTVVCPDCNDRLSLRDLFDDGCRCVDCSDKSSTSNRQT